MLSVIRAHRFGHSYPWFRSRVPMFMVIRAHVRGHYFSMFCVPVNIGAFILSIYMFSILKPLMYYIDVLPFVLESGLGC